MFNALELIRSNPAAKIFEIDGLLFAQFSCPKQESPVLLWAEMDFLLHVLSGRSTWKTSTGMHSADEGESVFFKRGAHIMPEHLEEHLCLELFFVPDGFLRETMLEFAPDLPPGVDISDPQELTIRVNNDVALTAFFQAMSVYFSCEEKPPEMLLKLKLKELLASILAGNNNPELSAYFRFIASSDGPGIPAIMERNFCHNLPIEVFAKMCNRSVSSFKRDFQKIYGISPGKWLLGRRLKHAASLLQNTALSITEAALECGFEDTSHFSKSFKGKFGMPPSSYRDTLLSATY